MQNDDNYQAAFLALKDAYRTREKLKRMLRIYCGKKLEEISLANTLLDLVSDVMDTAESEGWFDQLLLGAHRMTPGNQPLFVVVQQLGLLPTVTAVSRPEAIIREANVFIDLAVWNTRLSEAEFRVCRIETPHAQGSGFLIGPDLVLTNYHVLGHYLKAPSVYPADIRIRFDHKKLANGKVLDGKTLRLAQDWFVDASQPSSLDDVSHSLTQLPAVDELDYAIVRLSQSIGNEELSGKGRPNARKRGWFNLSELHSTALISSLTPGASLFILQYPHGSPLMLAFDTNSIIQMNANQTRVRYRTNTMPGSSGAPGFNQMMDLVCLHRGGTQDAHSSMRYNEGIPIVSIRDLLVKRGLESVLRSLDT
ncbi:trypsin-like peptidase domain-containing protein [Dictyobacter aurantiacus]|nr:trypsin-like peptidase domain-containing protein [Dictyobacter aurantiacus]